MKIAEAGKIYGKITMQPGGSTAEMLENFLDRKPSTETFFAMFEAVIIVEYAGIVVPIINCPNSAKHLLLLVSQPIHLDAGHLCFGRI